MTRQVGSGTEARYIPTVGRPVDRAWIDHFSEVVGPVLPPGAELRLRAKPGITYTSSAIFLRAAHLPLQLPLHEEVKQQYLHSFANSVTEALCDRGRMDIEVARNGLALALHQPKTLRIKRVEGPSLLISAYVDDLPNTTPDGENIGGHIVATEKDALTSYYGQTGLNRPEPRPTPRHPILLGTIIGYDQAEPLINDLYAVEEELQGPVLVHGLDILRLETR